MLWSPYTYLTLLLAAVIAIVLWHRNLACRELANRIASETCKHADVQLLDGTVAFSRFAGGRDTAGRWSLLRTYVFDYTDNGVNRRQGFVVLRGLNLEAVGLAPVAIH
ncbi:MAG TPA: DUF3301 domain-containing protein [Steroidobacteraceae bacterium]|nr:DUF3301 domain-containing protein [Steroidobacteraceae bacterium]